MSQSASALRTATARAGRTEPWRSWIAWRMQLLRAGESGAYRNPILAGHDAVLRDVTLIAKLGILGFPWRRGPVEPDRFRLLERAIAMARPEGLWMEFGVANGRSIAFIATRTGAPVYGFDTFEGLPEHWSPRMRAGRFSRGGVPPPAPTNVVFVKGLFDRTLPEFLVSRSEVMAAFVHIDCDLYSSTRTVLANLGRRIRAGSVLVFDEFCGLLPDDECRAWREHCRANGLHFEWIGATRGGAVAVRVGASETS